MTPIEEINHKEVLYEIKQDRQGRFYLYKIKYNKIYEDYIGSGETIKDIKAIIDNKIEDVEPVDEGQMEFKL